MNELRWPCDFDFYFICVSEMPDGVSVHIPAESIITIRNEYGVAIASIRVNEQTFVEVRRDVRDHA